MDMNCPPYSHTQPCTQESICHRHILLRLIYLVKRRMMLGVLPLRLVGCHSRSAAGEADRTFLPDRGSTTKIFVDFYEDFRVYFWFDRTIILISYDKGVWFDETFMLV